MKLERACVPLGLAWSSPFARWQGPLAEVNSIDLAVDVTKRALEERGLPSEAFTDLVLGWTVPQKEIFYGAPTVAARIGAEGVTGPMVSQACATSVACLQAAAANHEADADDGDVTLVVTTDRTSNGPLVMYPSPSGPGGSPQVENGSQTHPADGTAGMVVTSEKRARELSPDGGSVRLLGIGFARVEKARMPKAPVPAAEMALDNAGIPISDVDAIKTHNPFAVNDVYFSRQMGVSLEEMNDYGLPMPKPEQMEARAERVVRSFLKLFGREPGTIGNTGSSMNGLEGHS